MGRELNSEKMKLIRNAIKAGLSQKEICKTFRVSNRTVMKLQTGCIYTSNITTEKARAKSEKTRISALANLRNARNNWSKFFVGQTIGVVKMRDTKGTFEEELEWLSYTGDILCKTENFLTVRAKNFRHTIHFSDYISNRVKIDPQN